MFLNVCKLNIVSIRCFAIQAGGILVAYTPQLKMIEPGTVVNIGELEFSSISILYQLQFAVGKVGRLIVFICPLFASDPAAETQFSRIIELIF